MNSHQRRKAQRATKRSLCPHMTMTDLLRFYMQPAVQVMASRIESDLLRMVCVVNPRKPLPPEQGFLRYEDAKRLPPDTKVVALPYTASPVMEWVPRNPERGTPDPETFEEAKQRMADRMAHAVDKMEARMYRNHLRVPRTGLGKSRVEGQDV